MNIFVLDKNPRLAAEYHCDKHVVKMILETAQLLSNVHHVINGDGPYRKTHVNHPCSKWAMQSIENYRWLSNLGLELCREYTQRYGKIHKTQSILEWLSENIPDIPIGDLTPFYAAMPNDAKNLT